MKPRFLLQIELKYILNCNTFSVLPSIINENVKNIANEPAIICDVTNIQEKKTF